MISGSSFVEVAGAGHVMQHAPEAIVSAPLRFFEYYAAAGFVGPGVEVFDSTFS